MCIEQKSACPGALARPCAPAARRSKSAFNTLQSPDLLSSEQGARVQAFTLQVPGRSPQCSALAGVAFCVDLPKSSTLLPLNI